MERFVEGAIRFTEIWKTVERVLAAHRAIEHAPLDAILEADR